MKKMGLKDEVLLQGYDSYMEHILKPAGITLEELKSHPEGMQGKNLIPPAEKTYETQPFYTPSGKVELKSLVLEKYKASHGYDGLPVYHDYRIETSIDREDYPLILSTGSRKPQLFHARLYRMPWLAGIEKEPLVEIHPEDGKRYGIADGSPVRLITPAGEAKGIAAYDIAGQPGIAYIYHGSSKGDANELIGKDYLDPISGFPGFKGYFCRIEAVKEEECQYDKV